MSPASSSLLRTSAPASSTVAPTDLINPAGMVSSPPRTVPTMSTARPLAVALARPRKSVSSKAAGKRPMSPEPPLSNSVGLSSTPDLCFSYPSTSQIGRGSLDLDLPLPTPPNGAPLFATEDSRTVGPGSPRSLSTKEASLRAMAPSSRTAKPHTMSPKKPLQPAPSGPAPTHLSTQPATSLPPVKGARVHGIGATEQSASWQGVRTDHLDQTGSVHKVPKPVMVALNRACEVTGTRMQSSARSKSGPLSRFFDLARDASTWFATDNAHLGQSTRGGNLATVSAGSSSSPRSKGRVIDLYPQDESVWRCNACGVPVSLPDELVSTHFTGTHGCAYLMNSTINTMWGGEVERSLLTGNHVVADMDCILCGQRLGWSYRQADNPTQRYKVGRHILEMTNVHQDLGWI